MHSGKTPYYISVLVHVLVWALLGFGILIYNPLNWGITLPAPFWIITIIHLLTLIILFYINSLRAVPQLLLKNRITTFIIWVLAVTAIILTINQFLDAQLHVRELIDKALGIKKHKDQFVNVFVLTTVLLVLGISTSITLIQHWQQQNLARQVLEQQQISSELSMLKTQINPHFFFNTLNNIYALTFVDVEKSRDSLHKLSRMMRYLLYESHDKVPLSKELSFIRDYIELMRMRLQDNTVLEVEAPPEIIDRPIYPMLLMPFVENAFKHGVSASAPGRIRIGFYQYENKFCLEVENTVARKTQPLIEEAGGIGLANTRRRLELLYPGHYRLEINPSSGNNHYILLEIDL